MKLIPTDRPAQITWLLAAAGIDYEVVRPVGLDEYEDAGSQGYRGAPGIEIDDDAGERWDAAARGWAASPEGDRVAKLRYQLPILVGAGDEAAVAAHVDAVAAWLTSWMSDPDAMPWPERRTAMPRWVR